MEAMKGLYNRAYLFLTTNFDREISTKEKVIDNAVQDFFKKDEYAHLNSSERQIAMKVKIIKEYYKLDNVEDKEKRLNDAAVRIERSMGRKLNVLQNLKSLPNQVIKKQTNPDFQSKKVAYLQYLKVTDYKGEAKLKKYLENGEVQKLAQRIESDMEKEVTLKDLGKSLALTYRKDILAIFNQMGKKSPGAEDITEMYQAIILLQKGDQFAGAVKGLDAYIDRCDSNTQNELEYIVSAVQQTMPSIGAIEDGTIYNKTN